MEIGFLSRHHVNPFGPVNFLIHYIENVNRVGEGGGGEKGWGSEKRESFLILDLEGRKLEACNSY